MDGDGGLSADITPVASADLALTPGMTVYFVIKATAIAIYHKRQAHLAASNSPYLPNVDRG